MRIMSSFGAQTGDRRSQSIDRAFDAGLPASVQREKIRWALSWAVNSLGPGEHDSGVALTDSVWMLWTGGRSLATHRMKTWSAAANDALPLVSVHWRDLAIMLDSVTLYRASRSEGDQTYFDCIAAVLGALGVISRELKG